jgi:hypothetical protein
MTVVPHPPYSPDLVPCDYSISRHFDAIEVIEAELQAVLGTVTEHGFRMNLKNGKRAGNGAYVREGIASRAIVVSRPKVSFDQMTAPILHIMDIDVVYVLHGEDLACLQ